MVSSRLPFFFNSRIASLALSGVRKGLLIVPGLVLFPVVEIKNSYDFRSTPLAVRANKIQLATSAVFKMDNTVCILFRCK